MSDDPVESEQPLTEIRKKPGYLQHFRIVVGAVSAGTLLASTLKILQKSNDFGPPFRLQFLAIQISMIYGTALLKIGPVLAPMLAILLIGLERIAKVRNKSQIIWAGILGGTFISLLNVPAYGDPYIRTGLLLAVVGATSGFIIGSDAWQLAHPTERAVTQFTLQTLLLLVLIWGGLMVIFQPIR